MPPTSLGIVVRSFRQKTKVSMRTLATQARVPLATLRDLESGRATNPGVYTVAAVADALGVRIDALLQDARRADAIMQNREKQYAPVLAEAAFHEAGHVVVALCLGLPFRFVALNDPTAKYIGLVEQSATGAYRWGAAKRNGPVRVPLFPQQENIVTVAVAGRIAEQRWAAKQAPPQQSPPGTDSADLKLAKASLLWLGGDESATLARLRQRASTLLDRSWDAVERVAAALLRSRRLSQQACKKLLLPPVPPARLNPQRSVEEQSVGG